MSGNQRDKPILDFDEWTTLAQNDPESFEIKRQEAIEFYISKVPERKQRRLRGLQWQIDQTCRIARTPMASCIAISSMMRDSLTLLNERQKEFLQYTTDGSIASTKMQQRSASILPFKSSDPVNKCRKKN